MSNRQRVHLKALYERCRQHPEKLSGALLLAFARGLEWPADRPGAVPYYERNPSAYAAFKAGRHSAHLWRVVRRADSSIERLERIAAR